MRAHFVQRLIPKVTTHTNIVQLSFRFKIHVAGGFVLTMRGFDDVFITALLTTFASVSEEGGSCQGNPVAAGKRGVPAADRGAGGYLSPGVGR